MTGGGAAQGDVLPERLEEFVAIAERKDEIECRDCGDPVERRFAGNWRCIGCELRANGGDSA